MSQIQPQYWSQEFLWCSVIEKHVQSGPTCGSEGLKASRGFFVFLFFFYPVLEINFWEQFMEPYWFFHVCVQWLSHVWLFATPWTAAHQAPLSMGFFQARILEWVTISFSRGSSQPRDWTHVSCVSCTGRRGLYYWATREAPLILSLRGQYAQLVKMYPWLFSFMRGWCGGWGSNGGYHQWTTYQQTCRKLALHMLFQWILLPNWEVVQVLPSIVEKNKKQKPYRSVVLIHIKSCCLSNPLLSNILPQCHDLEHTFII